jgi:hypothetical protein
MYRRTIGIVVVMLVSIVISGILTGCHEPAKVSHPSGKSAPKTTSASMPSRTKGRMMEKEHIMMSMCPMHHMMMGTMMNKSLVATADGVVVMAGEKLIKFDKDLNLVKEVKIEMDMEGMQKKMSQMMEGCPMCKGKMQRRGMMKKGDRK